VNVLFIGDIVGPQATVALAERLPTLRARHDVDLVIANAENCAITGPLPTDGFGMTAALVDRLIDAGVDVITGGNHSWDGPEAESALAHDSVIRPLNVGEGPPGRGRVTVDVRGEPVTVVNLISPTAKLREVRYLRDSLMPQASRPYEAWSALEATGTTIVDFHGDSVWEKMSFARNVDGRAAAVLGTHTHEPTENLHVLPGGTAFVAEVGMTGQAGGVGAGFDNAHFAAMMRGEDPESLPPLRVSEGPVTLGAVLLHLDGGLTTAIERVR
jgi:2',3'-cyclic-nucleotide 2'-phosphodiesterase